MVFIIEEAKETILNFKLYFVLTQNQYTMTYYNTLNVKLSNLQLNKLKSGIKKGTEVTLKLSSNVSGDSNDENSFLHKLLLTNAQVLRLRKTFGNGSSANIKLSKTHLHKIGQSEGFLVRLLVLKNGLSFNEKCT